jgi:lipoyl(octanoyl) transferase
MQMTTKLNSLDSMGALPLLVVRLPLTDYVGAGELQAQIVRKKTLSPFNDVLLHLEHPWTITFGTRGSESDLLVSPEELAREGIALHYADRGGRSTCHGPGQAVCYPILDLRRMGISAREYVRQLEETIIRALAAFEVNGYRQPGKVGVWVGPKDKIGSIGVRIQRRITSHGFSFNVDMRRDPGRFMVSCGMSDARQVSLAELTSAPVSLEEVQDMITVSFTEVFQPATVKHVGTEELLAEIMTD